MKGGGAEINGLTVVSRRHHTNWINLTGHNKQIKDMYHEDLIKRSFRWCLGDICCYGTVKHSDLGAEKRDERMMCGC
nr:hypothetical protein [Tanacetum cinerariifolium]